MPSVSRHVRATVASSAVVALAVALSACAGASSPAQAVGAGGALAASSPAPVEQLRADRPPAPEPSTPVPEAPPAPPVLAQPVRVAVPSVGIDAALVPLGLEPEGTMEVPSDFEVAGWYVDGPEPGEPGAAVIAGHVDSYTGPAVFFSLRDVVPGAAIDVELADGGTQRFVVEAIEQHPKGAFPTERVFGRTDGPTLRLVTCGGPFDREARSYLDNVVVYASPAP